MKNVTKGFWSIALTVLCALAPMPSNSAYAQVAVYDPANHIENLMQALRMLKSNLNEATQIKNQVKSLANEFENLKKLDFSMIEDFSNQMTDLFEVTGSINGLMQDFSSLQSEFEKVYPNFGAQTGIDAEELAKKAAEWLDMSRNSLLGAAQTGAKVLETLPRSQEQLQDLVTQSQGAHGILQAAQAGNQLAASIAGNLQSLNSQLATYSQAHMTFMMQQQAGQAAMQARGRSAMEGWGKRTTFVTAPLPGI